MEFSVCKKNKFSRPSEMAIYFAELHSASTSIENKKDLGQFFTSEEIAKYMALLVDPKKFKEEIFILEPGAGSGILICKTVERILEISSNVKKVTIQLFEIDITIIEKLEAVLHFLKSYTFKRNVSLDFSISNENFISHYKNLLDKQRKTFLFDLIVCNPPYYKVKSSSLDGRLNDSKKKNWIPNIYAVFMLIATKVVKRNGQIVFVNPSSFISGTTFKKFREAFILNSQFANIHIFEERVNLFKGQNVLQEVVISKFQPKQTTDFHNVSISLSKNLLDLNKPKYYRFKEENIVNYQSSAIYLPRSYDDIKVLSEINQLKFNLKTVGMKAHTGKVVFFRNLDYLSEVECESTVPLFWMTNIYPMQIKWPNTKNDKGQNILVNTVKNVLISNENCILVRRFSAKGDANRLICAPFISSVYGSYSKIGIENRVNYIKKVDGKLSDNETVGIAAILSSTKYNKYIKVITGNTNVSSTQLNDLPLPSFEIITKIGCEILNTDYSIENIDKIINENLAQI